MKKVLVILGLLMVLFVVGCVQQPQEIVKEVPVEVVKEVTKYQCANGDIKGDLDDCPKEVKKTSHYLKGMGQQATEMFYLDNGINRFEMQSTGSGHFSMVLYDEYGDYIDLLANEIGRFEGSTIVPIRNEGNYIIQVKADSNWEVKIN